MLPLVLSITVVVIGRGWLSNDVMACGFPLSYTSKSSWIRLRNSCRSASVTVTSRATVLVDASILRTRVDSPEDGRREDRRERTYGHFEDSCL